MRAAVLFLASALVVPQALLVAQKKPITLDTLEEATRLTPQGLGNPVAWNADGSKFLYRQGRRLMVYDPAAKSSKELLDTTALDAAVVKPVSQEAQPFDWENRRVRDTPVQWSSTGNQILYATGGDVFVIDAA